MEFDCASLNSMVTLLDASSSGHLRPIKGVPTVPLFKVERIIPIYLERVASPVLYEIPDPQRQSRAQCAASPSLLLHRLKREHSINCILNYFYNLKASNRGALLNLTGHEMPSAAAACCKLTG
jgi:hypothetical protein